jgi:hypothetical protein
MGKNRRSTFARIAVIGTCVLALTTCDAFKAGLGPKIDISAPSVDVKSIANGAYLRGVVTLSGVASDDVSVSSVTILVAIDSTQVASISATLSNGVWSAQLDTAALAGGKEVQADLTIRVKDGKDNATDKKLVVYFDNVEPVINLTSPTKDNLSSIEYALSETETMTGSVKDGLGIAKVQMTTGALTYTQSSNPATWSFSVDTTQYYDSSTGDAKSANGASKVSSADSALYVVSYSIMATDLAGNTSTPIASSFYINPNGSPVVDIHGQTPAISSKILYPNVPDLANISTWESNALSPGDTIRFRVYDMDGLDTSASGLSLVLIPASQKAALAAAISGGTLSSFLSAYKYTVGGASGQALTESIIQYSANSSTVPMKADYSLTLPSKLNSTTMPEYGEYMLLVHCSDLATNKQSATSASCDTPSASSGANQYISLYITKGAPVVTVTKPANGAFVKSFESSGTIEDALGPLAIAVTVGSVTDAAATLVELGGSSTKSSWSYSYAGTAMTDGNYEASILGKNKAGVNSASQTIQFTIDTTAPEASVQAVYPAVAGSLSMTAFKDDTTVSAAPGGVLDTVNGMVRFKGLASDSAALSSVTWEIRHVLSTASSPWTVEAAAVESGSFSSSSMSLWSLDIDTTDASKYADGNRYVLYVTPTDKAGNVGSPAARSFLVNQASDQPTFSLSNMDSSATLKTLAKNNLLTTKISLSATVSDDDRVDPDLVKILIDPVDGSGNPSPSGTPVNASYTSVSGAVNSGTGEVSFSYSFVATGNGTGYALSEGRHFFYLVANDLSAYKDGKATVAATIGPVWFAVDSVQPQISFTQSGGLYVSSSQALSGTVYSANALDDTAPFVIKVGSGSATAASTFAPAASATGSHNWTYTLDVGGIAADGSLAMTATAKDEFGLGSSSTFTVTVDRTPPTIVISNATQVFSSVNGMSLMGTTKDITSGVASMTATIDGVDASSLITLNATTGTPNTVGNWSLDLSSAATGTHAIVLHAVDKADNGYSPASFNVKVDNDSPTATIDQILGAAVDGAYYSSLSAMPSDWSGTVGDAFFSSATVSLDGATIATSSSAGAWSVPMNWASVAEGSHTLMVKAYDQGGHSSSATATFFKDTIAPTLTISAPVNEESTSDSTYGILGTTRDTGGAGFGSAFRAVEYQLDGGAWIDISSSLSGTSWSKPGVSLGTVEGTHTLSFRSTDKLGNASAIETRTLYYDLARPELSETMVNTTDTKYTSGDVSFGGVAYDTNALSKLEVSLDEGTASTLSLTTITLDLAADGTFTAAGHGFLVGDRIQISGASLPTVSSAGLLSGTVLYYIKTVTTDTFTISATKGGPALSFSDTGSGLTTKRWSYTLTGTAEGAHSVVFTATDVAKKTTSVTRAVLVDKTKPIVTPPFIAAGSYFDASATLNGTVSDPATVGVASGVARVQYSSDYTNDSNDLNDTWQDASGTTSWTQTIALSALGEGTKVVYFRGEDKAGLYSDIVSVSLNIDHKAPRAEITTPASTDLIATNGAVAFSGYADDSALTAGRLAKTAVLSYTKNGGVASEVTIVDADGADDDLATTGDNVPGAPNGAWSWSLPAYQAAVGAGSFAIGKEYVIVSTGSVGSETDFTLLGAFDNTVGTHFTATGAGSSATSGTACLAGANDGLYVITLTVTDVANKTSSATRTVQIDTTAPSLVVSAPVNLESTDNPSYTIKGTTRDTGGVGFEGVFKVSYKLDSGAWADLSSTLVGTDWSLAGVSLGSVEGTHTLSFQSKDKLGNLTTVGPLTLYYDKAAPSLTETDVGTTDTKYANADLVLGGSAFDSNGLSKLELKVDGGTAVLIPTASITSLSLSLDKGSDTFTAVGHGFSDGQTIQFCGNDMPSLSPSGSLSPTALYYVRNSNANTFQVSATASGAILDFAGSGTDSSLSRTRWAYTVDVDTDGAGSDGGLAEGAHSLVFTATDAANKTSSFTRTIYVDTTAPVAAIAAPASLVNTAPAYWNRGVVSMSGTVAELAEGSGVASVQVAITAKGASAPSSYSVAALNGGAWSYSFDSNPAAVTEGEKTLYVRAVDKVGNTQAAVTRDFGIDKSDPVLSGLTVDGLSYGALVYKKGSIILGGSAVDGLSVSKVVIEEKAPSGSYAVAATLTTGLGSWTWSRVLDGSSAEGQYDYRIIAWDTAGNANTTSSNATMSVFFDRTAPAAPAATAPTDSYYGDETMTARGTASELGTAQSGLDKIQWSADNANWYTAEGTASWTASVDLRDSALNLTGYHNEGHQTLYLRAVDKAGNASDSVTPKTVPFWLDRADPVASVYSPTASKRTNCKADFSVSVDASDNNGIASVDFVAGTSSPDFTVPANIHATATAATGGHWTAAVPAAKMGLLSSSAQNGIYMRVKDASGRSTYLSLPILVDKTPPTVSFSSPADSATVNKSIAISGVGGDDQGLASVVVDIQKSDSSWESLRTFSNTAGFNWSIAGFDTEAYGVAAYDSDNNSANGIQLKLRATATDEAGNQNETVMTRLLTVDQNSDRPTIKLTNLPTVDGTTTLIMTKVVYGTVSDDDGVSYFEVSETPFDAAGAGIDATAAALDDTFTSAGHGFTDGQPVYFTGADLPAGILASTRYYVIYVDANHYKVTSDDASVSVKTPVDLTSNGTAMKAYHLNVTNLKASFSGQIWSCTASDDDGDKYIYFRVTDTQGAVFVTHDGGAESLDEPIIYLTASSHVHDKVYYLVDTVTPEFAAISPIIVDRTGDDFSSPIYDMTTNMAFGGPSASFSLMARASDVNGIKKISVTVPNAVSVPAGTTSAFTTSQVEARAIGAVVGAATVVAGARYEIVSVGSSDFTQLGASTGFAEGSQFYASRAGTAGDGNGTVRLVMNAWKTGTISVAGVVDGFVTVTVAVEDKSGLTSTSTRTILVDNSPPTLTFTNPSNASIANGEITVSGSAVDSGSGLDAITYRIGKNYASKSPVAVSGSVYQWEIPFTGTSKLDSFSSMYSGQTTFASAGNSFTSASLAGNAEIAVGNAIKVDDTYRKITAWTVASGSLTFDGAQVAAGKTIAFEVYTNVKAIHDNSTGVDLFVLPLVLKAADKAGNSIETLPIAGTSEARASQTNLAADSIVGNTVVAIGQIIMVGDNARIISAWDQASGKVSWSGNVATSETSFTIYPYSLRIDPNGDKPKAVVAYPDNGTTLGGSVRIYGSAEDDDSVANVYMQIDTNNDGLYNASDTVNSVEWGSDRGVQITGSTSWNWTINSDEEFDDLSTGPVTITFRVRAEDIYDTTGPWSTERTITLRKDVPKIGTAAPLTLVNDDDPSVKVAYTYGMYIKGNWHLTGSVENDTALSNITFSYKVNNVTTTSSIKWTDSGSYELSDVGAFSLVTPATAPPQVVGQYKRIDLNIPIVSPTTSFRRLEPTLTAWDVAETPANSALAMRFNMDPVAPTAPSGPGFDSVSNFMVQDNGWCKISGTALDADSDVEKVLVYFVRKYKNSANDCLYNPKTANTHALYSGITWDAGAPVVSGTVSVAAESLMDSNLASSAVKDLISVGQTINVGGYDKVITTWIPATGTIGWTGAVTAGTMKYTIQLGIVIDHKDVTETHDGSSVLNDDGDGYAEKLKQTVGTTYDWYADIDSSNIPDGPIEIHYVVYDMAGNYAQGTQATFVQNHPIAVSKIWLGTDLDGSGAVDTSTASTERLGYADGDTVTAGFQASTSFVVKEAPMSFDVELTGGNGKIDYAVYVASGAMAESASVVDSYYVIASIGSSNTFPSGSVVGSVFKEYAGRIKGNGTLYPAIQYGTLRADGSSSPAQIVLIDGTITSLVGQGAKSFTIGLWDSTDGTTLGIDSLTVKPTIGCTINTVDGVNPISVVSPLFWNSSTDNSLYGSSTGNGHIELSGVYTAANPDLSGIVTIRGSSFDDQRILGVWMQVDNFNFPNAAANDALGTAYTFYKVSAYNKATSTFSSLGTLASDGWHFAVDSSSFDQAGHRIAWHLDLDTSMITGKVGKGLGIRCMVVDKKGGDGLTGNKSSLIAYASANTLSGTGGSYDSDKTQWSIQSNALKGLSSVWTGMDISFGGYRTKIYSYDSETGTITLPYSFAYSVADSSAWSIRTAQNVAPVDVVPYIAKVKTSLSAYYVAKPSVYNRTALGHYPVRENEDIYVYGFNFDTTSASATTIKIGSTTLSASVAGNGGDLDVADAAYKYVKVNVGASASSGAMTASVGTSPNDVASINNSDSNSGTSAPWNILANSVNNNLLDDDVNLDVWQFTTVAQSVSGAINNPKMKVGPSGQLGFSFGQSTVFYSMPGLRNGDSVYQSHTPFLMNYGWFTENDFAYDGQGNTYGIVFCPDTSSPAGTTSNMNLLSRMANNTVANYGLNDSDNANGSYNYRLANSSQTFSDTTTKVTNIFRIQSPGLVVTMPNPNLPASASNLVSLYYAYYDDLTKEIRFRTGTIGANPDSISTSLQDIGQYQGTIVARGTRLGAYPRDIPNSQYQCVAATALAGGFSELKETTTAQPGPYLALGVIPAGTYGVSNPSRDVALLAWYDQYHAKLYFSYNDDPMSTLGGSGTTVNATAMATGTSYTIATLGTTTFSDFGAPFNTVGTTFTSAPCFSGTGTVYATAGTQAATTMEIGKTYRISALGDSLFDRFGAASNTVNTVFTCIAPTNFSGVGTGTVIGLSNLISAASMTAGSTYWINSTGTTDFREYGAADNNQGTSFVAAAGSSFAYAGTGTLFSSTNQTAVIAGSTYMVTVVGDSTNWASFCGSANPTQYSIFTAAAGGTVNGTTGRVVPVVGAATSMANGTIYRVGARGTTDFTRYGSTSNNAGTSFTASYATLSRAGTGTVYGLMNATSMVEGSLYQIVSTGSTTFTNFGAASNTSGVKFTAVYPRGSGTVKPIIAVPSMVVGTGYTIYTAGTTGFTKYGAANSNVGTTFTAALPTYAAAGSGTTTTSVATSASQWQSHAYQVDSATDSAGLNVKMAVDSDGGIHLAYYSAAGGDLKYAYLTKYNDSSFQRATVDSYLSVGTNVCIDVAKVGSYQVPYISYFMPAAFGTTASAKIAYRARFTNDLGQSNTLTGQFDGATGDLYTQNWEVSSVPTAYTPANSSVNIAVFRNSGGDLAAIPPGTNTVTTDTVTSGGWKVSPGRRIFGNGTTNPAVSYAVEENGILEMAQKK